MCDLVKIDPAGFVDLRYQSVKQFCRRFTKNLWSHDVKYRTGDGKDHHADQPDLIFAHITQ